MLGYDVPIDAMVALLSFIAGSGFLYLAVKRWEKTQLIRNTATETASSMAVGRTEIQGEAIPAGDDILKQPFDDGHCVYAWYEIEQKKRSLLSPSNDQQQQRWMTLDKNEIVVPFAVDDGTQKVYVNLSDEPEFNLSGENRVRESVRSWESEPDAVPAFLDRYQNVDETRSGIGGVLDGVSRRYRSSVLPAGDTVYVFGSTDLNDNGVPIIGRDGETGEFIVSDHSAEGLATRLSWEAGGSAIAGIAFFAFGFYAILFDIPTLF